VTFSSIHSMMVCHAMVTRDILNMDHHSFSSLFYIPYLWSLHFVLHLTMAVYSVPPTLPCHLKHAENS
jgi:hypothetical protein